MTNTASSAVVTPTTTTAVLQTCVGLESHAIRQLRTLCSEESDVATDAKGGDGGANADDDKHDSQAAAPCFVAIGGYGAFLMRGRVMVVWRGGSARAVARLRRLVAKLDVVSASRVVDAALVSGGGGGGGAAIVRALAARSLATLLPAVRAAPSFRVTGVRHGERATSLASTDAARAVATTLGKVARGAAGDRASIHQPSFETGGMLSHFISLRGEGGGGCNEGATTMTTFAS